MSLAAIITIVLYVAETLHAVYNMDRPPTINNSIYILRAKNFVAINRLREYQEEKERKGSREVNKDDTDASDGVEVIMVQQEKIPNKKNKKVEEHIHTLENIILTTEEIEEVTSENKVCARLLQECFEGCEQKRGLCEDWRNFYPVD